MKHVHLVSSLMLCAALAACKGVPHRAEPMPATAHANLNAVAWMQSSAEYEASVRGVYAAARERLDQAMSDPGWSALPPDERREGFETLPPAIIVDADETMIDNSPFQAREVHEGGGFRYEHWLAWVNERRARALPGAADFADYVAQRGVAIYFITNRDAPAETESTIANLRALGFPIAADASNVMLRGDLRAPAREKGERRRWVAQRHRVLLVLGDNLGDFMDGVATTVESRQQRVGAFADWWGERWFMLPNPSYGSWEASLLARCQDQPGIGEDLCKQRHLRLE